MKEITFLNNNVKRWREFESLLGKPSETEPDKLSDMFIGITDDLSYAQTYFPGTETEFYLNSIAIKTHNIIYKTKKERKTSLSEFWKYIFPLELYKSRKYILYSFFFFFTACLIGGISAANDDTFVRLILGDYYVNMTLDNIDKGDPMAIYKTANEINMFLGITINNIKVSFIAFLFGIFTSLGTILILFQNGVMLGSFQYFFYEQNVLYESVLSIWIHGTLEIFAIIIAGAAGIIMGTGILFPGTYTRKASFLQSARRGMKIVLGLIPVFIIAGFLEGFVTRHTNWHDAIRISIIVISLIIILLYFFIYPIKLNKRLNKDIEFKEFIKEMSK